MEEVEIVKADGDNKDEAVSQLQQKVNDLENIISGLNPRNLAGLSASQLSGVLGKFGGDGSDGVLNITSGTTTINLGGADYVEKNYESISITGTGALAFSNPSSIGTVINLKSKGDVILTSSAAALISTDGMGGTGGAKNPSGGNGDDGNPGLGTVDSSVGGGGGVEGASGVIAGGTAGASSTFIKTIAGGVIRAICGAGGGGGGRASSGFAGTAGDGGDGGGALIIECGGSLNFTGTITAKGVAGEAATASGSWCGAGGGGGGGGGTVAIIYNNLTANTGTVTVTGGAGGNGGSSNDTRTSSGGGGGGSYNEGTVGGSSSAGSSGAGGAGAAGTYYIAENNQFV